MKSNESDKLSSLKVDNDTIPWQESLLGMDQNQIVSAEIATFTSNLKLYKKDAADQLPWLQQHADKSMNKDDIVVRHVLTLMDCNDVLESGGNLYEVLFPHLGSDVYYYAHRAKQLSRLLEATKNEIYTQAKVWDEHNAKRIIEEAHALAVSLSETERQLLYKRISVEPERLDEKIIRYAKKTKNYAVTSAISASTGGILQGVSISAAVAGAALNPLSEVNPYIANASLGLSFGIWLASAYVYAGENWNALEEIDIGTRIGAKLAHDIARYFNVSKNMQKAATFAGFITPNLINRATYMAGAYYLSDDISRIVGTQTQNNEISALIASNVAISIMNLIFAEATRQGVALVKDKNTNADYNE